MTPRLRTLLLAACTLALLSPSVAPDASAQERDTPPRERDARERTVRVLEPVTAQRGWLGFRYAPLPSGGGVRVAEVVEESPAAAAGLAVGDVILRVNGEAASEERIRRLEREPGERVRLRIHRSGRERELTVVAARRPPPRVTIVTPGRSVTLDMDSVRRQTVIAMDTLRSVLDRFKVEIDGETIRLDSIGGESVRILREMDFDSVFPGRGRVLFGPWSAPALAGAELSELNPDLGSYFGTERGVLVLRISPETPAARAGLRAGDVVQRAGGAEVASARELQRAIQGSDDGELQLDVLRDGKPVQLRLRWQVGRTLRTR
ncbi:hypothetical protein BH20GEM2_BH20GEM2_08520 [soil metagenome]